MDSIQLLNTLEKTRISNVIITQLAKSATSVGANYEESQATHSKKEFYHKIGISLREIRESHYWLRIIKSQNWVKNYKELEILINEANELKLIFGKIFSGRKKENI